MKFTELQCKRCKTKTFWVDTFKDDIILICTACKQHKILTRFKNGKKD